MAGAALAGGGAVGAERVESAFAIKLLGTGAADYPWASRELEAPGMRGSCSTLLNGHTLIDCGTTGFANLKRFGVDLDRLAGLVFTHSHSDHFNIKQVEKILVERSDSVAPLNIWGSEQIIESLVGKLPAELYRGSAVRSGSKFESEGLSFTVLPANHELPNPDEQAFHFLVESKGKHLLYALDGAWMLKAARKLIGKTHLDMIIWDATMAETGDYRIFEHNDLAMIELMLRSFRSTGIVDNRTRSVLNHVARTLWPQDPDECKALAEARGCIMALDGMVLSI